MKNRTIKNLKEKSKPDLKGFKLPESGINKKYTLPEELTRKTLDLPELSEVEVMRHFQELSRLNYGVDDGFYPLGSCTMKYNPRINEKMAAHPDFNIHPLAQDKNVQGALQLIFELESMIKSITGMDAVCLQPHAGAHGELLGLMLIRAYHQDKKTGKDVILVPNSAHGTNPASVTVCGFKPLEVGSLADGNVDIDDLKSKMNDKVAGIMLTIPNTVGIFEQNILTITKLVHDAGGLCYMDGANMNALMGMVKPADMGIDVMHLNLHKSFGTPHGGGGPGAGAVGVNSVLTGYLPVPVVKESNGVYTRDYSLPKSIGKITAFMGNFGVLVRAYVYLKILGKEGVTQIAENAVLNANYAFSRLKKYYHAPIERTCMHEFVITDKNLPNHVTTLDVAKRLLDYGYHPPTIYFPLIIKGVMMIEPTETETKENIDGFVDTLIKIQEEAEKSPELVKNAPFDTPVKRLDEVSAARKPCLNWNMEE